MHTMHRTAVSKVVAATVALVIVVALIAALVLLKNSTTMPSQTSTTTSHSTATTTSSYTTTTSVTPTQASTTSTVPSSLRLGPHNSSLFVDDSNSGTPDALDPATGFSGTEWSLFSSVFQQLVEFNGTDINHPVPALASNFSIENNYQTYMFWIRSNVTFSNGDPLNAYAVWFSYVRELYLGQAVGISNYYELTVNASSLSTGLILPWGILNAIQAATGLPATTNTSVAESVLNTMLSNFNPSNSTQLAIMSYPNQAYVVTGPMTFKVNLLVHYRFFLQDIAAWWGAIVDPAYVDAHGGVQANTPNSYFSANSGPGTGPYMVKSVGAAYSNAVLVLNPFYWAKGASGLPTVLEPGRINVVVINYGLSHNDRVEEFANNIVQMSTVSVPFFQQMYSSYQYRNYYSFKQIFVNVGLYPQFYYLSMNTQEYPTNNANFRLAVVHSINYTELLDESYSFNGTVYGVNMLGPVDPTLQPYYNPGNLPLYSFDTKLAAHYLNIAGQQENFSVTLPNGTVIGDTSAPALGPLTIYYLTPISPLTQTQLSIIQQGLSSIGLTVGYEGVTPSVAGEWTSPLSTPNFLINNWAIDWPDPILQEIAPALTVSSYLPAWVNNSQVNQIMATLPFLTNQTQQIQLVKWLYNWTYWNAPYAWLPDPDRYFFVQPYVGGFVYNIILGYYYNSLYYRD